MDSSLSGIEKCPDYVARAQRGQKAGAILGPFGLRLLDEEASRIP
jgi:hypothetical protein